MNRFYCWSVLTWSDISAWDLTSLQHPFQPLHLCQRRSVRDGILKHKQSRKPQPIRVIRCTIVVFIHLIRILSSSIVPKHVNDKVEGETRCLLGGFLVSFNTHFLQWVGMEEGWRFFVLMLGRSMSYNMQGARGKKIQIIFPFPG